MKTLIGYIRVSTEEQGNARNGLEAQRAAIETFAAHKGYKVVQIVEEWASGKLNVEDRPVLAAAIKTCLKTKATLVVAKLDRLSREVALISHLMTTKLDIIVVALGEEVDPVMMHIYATFAERERAMISERTTAALAQLKAKGVRLGFHTHEDPTAIDVARANGCARNADKADAFAAKMRPTIERMLDSGMSYAKVADELNTIGTKTARGGQWAATTVANIKARWVD